MKKDLATVIVVILLVVILASLVFLIFKSVDRNYNQKSYHASNEEARSVPQFVFRGEIRMATSHNRVQRVLSEKL